MGSVGGGSAVDLPSYLSSYALWPPVSPKVCVYVCVCPVERSWLSGTEPFVPADIHHLHSLRRQRLPDPMRCDRTGGERVPLRSSNRRRKCQTGLKPIRVGHSAGTWIRVTAGVRRSGRGANFNSGLDTSANQRADGAKKVSWRRGRIGGGQGRRQVQGR